MTSHNNIISLHVIIGHTLNWDEPKRVPHFHVHLCVSYILVLALIRNSQYIEIQSCKFMKFRTKFISAQIMHKVC